MSEIKEGYQPTDKLDTSNPPSAVDAAEGNDFKTPYINPPRHIFLHKMTDNFTTILKLMFFDSEDDFYYLQLLQRKSDNPDLRSRGRVVKNYYIKSHEKLKQLKAEIIRLCDLMNARACIRLNRRSFRQCAFHSLEKITNQIMNENYYSVKGFYDKVCGQYNNETNKKWIVDIDGTGRASNEILRVIDRCDPPGDKLIAIIPSRNGLHLITTPFNIQQFSADYPEIDIHKDNPTNLYIP